MNERERKEDLTREILEAVATQEGLTQRSLANRMGVALGLANAYLKRCVRKGFVKIQQAPANRYLYYLTPGGFAEKSRLTAEYLTHSFDFYRQASESCVTALEACERNGWRRIVLCGASELAEIATLRVGDTTLEVLGYLALHDPKYREGGGRFLHRPVWTRFEEVPACDGFLVTELGDPGGAYEMLVGQVGLDRVFPLGILRIGPGAGADPRGVETAASAPDT